MRYKQIKMIVSIYYVDLIFHLSFQYSLCVYALQGPLEIFRNSVKKQKTKPEYPRSLIEVVKIIVNRYYFT